ncbi:MAG TPA: hypothetical protein VIV60_10095, partial [Polyangiaceae bacterium]
RHTSSAKIGPPARSRCDVMPISMLVGDSFRTIDPNGSNHGKLRAPNPGFETFVSPYAFTGDGRRSLGRSRALCRPPQGGVK